MDFRSSNERRRHTNENNCHVDWVMCESEWEVEFRRVVEDHPRVMFYVKNQDLGLTIPYRVDGRNRSYVPDFIVRIDDGAPEPINLIVEVKGFRGEDAKIKAETTQKSWIPAVNRLKMFGRWDFLEIKNVHTILEDLRAWFADCAYSPEVRSAHQLSLAGGSEPDLKPIPRRKSPTNV